jgi:SAM-dependent methyltransferase
MRYLDTENTNNGSLWNLLADRFNTFKLKKCIHPDAAVNIEVGWPILLSVIEEFRKTSYKKDINILDFGCGVGEFCRVLTNRKFKVTGIDHSAGMLELARRKVGKNIEFIHANHRHEVFDDRDMSKKFDVVTAIHSIEWINDLEVAFKNISKVIADNGLLVFVVFPKEHVADSIKINDLFEGFDSEENPFFGYANFDGVRVPVWVRTPKMYDNILKPLGFEKVLDVTPDYPADFFKKYKWTGSKYPEMSILAYRKKSVE